LRYLIYFRYLLRASVPVAVTARVVKAIHACHCNMATVYNLNMESLDFYSLSLLLQAYYTYGSSWNT
jgi:hypothetical protein